jgi:BirA family biotin operon repressor/biotin-[acetyl-CoA-carboxylase] ligase
VPFEIHWVRAQLPGRRIDYYDSIASTMPAAAQLAEQGAPSGTAVVAECQTAGQGRHGRAWLSEPGIGLYVSVIVRLPEAAEHFPALTLAAGLAAREAVGLCTGLDCDIRWPNDLLLDGHKCAGILTQAEQGVAVVGIGINVNHASFPGELAAIATSLRIASGHPHSREQLLVQLLRSLDLRRDALVRDGIPPLLRDFAEASSYVRGRRVRTGDGIEGITAGLDGSGFLLLRRSDGSIARVLAGGVRPA